MRDSQREFTDADGVVWVEKEKSWYRSPILLEHRVIATMYADFSESWPEDNRWDVTRYLTEFVKCHHEDDVNSAWGDTHREFTENERLFTDFEEAKADLARQMAEPVN